MNVCPECGQIFPESGFCTQDGAPLVSGGDDALLGAMLGPYRVAQVIGVGGMGRVYKGINPAIRSRVAIKVLSHDCVDRPELVERFFAEARAVNLIRHENIVNVLDLARLADGRPYIVMEFLDGAPLSRLLAQHGRIPLATMARFMAEVLAGLGAAHSKGVVHRDLKPDNVFITQHGRAKILDFGVAKLAPGDLEGLSPTRAGSLIGTPHYMSPEQAQSRPVDHRADLYAIGVILYEAATGRRPVEGESVFEILRRHVEESPIPPSRLAPDVPPLHEGLILRALEKDPARRWQSAEDLARALGDAAGTSTPAGWGAAGMRPDSAGLPTPPTHPPPRPVTHGSRTPLVATAGIALVGAAIAAVVVARRAGDTDAEESTDTTEARAAQDGVADGGRAADRPKQTAVPLSAQVRQDLSASGAGDASTNGAEQRAAETVRPSASGDGQPSNPDSKGAATSDAQPTEREDRPPAKGERKPPSRGGGKPSGKAGGKPAEQAEDAEPSGEDTETAEQASESGAATAREVPRDEPIQQASSWDVSGYLPKALARARRKFSDAVLIRIDAEGVYPNGKADLTLDEHFSVLYRFMSPSRAKRPANLPQGVKHKPTCIYYVLIDKDSVSSYPLEGWSCEDEHPIPMPRCSAKQIWRRAAADGAPTRNAVASLSYRFNAAGSALWWFSIGSQHQHRFDDDC